MLRRGVPFAVLALTVVALLAAQSVVSAFLPFGLRELVGYTLAAVARVEWIGELPDGAYFPRKAVLLSNDWLFELCDSSLALREGSEVAVFVKGSFIELYTGTSTVSVRVP